MTLGAHTRSHPDLRTLTTQEVRDELEASNQEITERVGLVPEHFAYPYGFWSRTAADVVGELYSTAVLGGTPRPSSRPDPLLLHRYPIQLSDGFAYFKARVRRGLRLEEMVRRKLKGYDGP